ncbi:MAG TPA: 2TM domain-containing protein [Chitinophagaceae bacterium]|nr:2TM domain-containing protein [Chitinophagaceae bacterium]
MKAVNRSIFSYLQIFLRFNTHLSIFLVVLPILWLVQYIERDVWGPEWLIVISIVWGSVLLVHFLVSWWKLRIKRNQNR